MEQSQAQRIIESLRKGIPPNGFVRQFTVGRKQEIDSLLQHLNNRDGGALLLKANYGSGKTHLLRFIREQALSDNYVVSMITLDANSAIRFNRMDQIFGAVCRNIENPYSPSEKGIYSFFNFIAKSINEQKEKFFWKNLSNNMRWDFSEILNSPGLFVAIRAWLTEESEVMNTIEDWLYQPWNYKGQRKKLYDNLVYNLRKFFRDPRPTWKFWDDEVFLFHTNGYRQSWAAIDDLDTLAKACGLKGMIILFDEFEDIITNIRRIDHQEAAFWNLFHFYANKQFKGKSFFAVTPEFSKKCQELLQGKGRWDYDFSLFDRLPTFAMSPLEITELEELAMKLLGVHGVAYSWEPDLKMKSSQFKKIIKDGASLPIQDRSRHVIISLVTALDDILQEQI